MLKSSEDKLERTIDVRTILRVVGLLKTLIKANFNKELSELLLMQRHEQYI